MENLQLKNINEENENGSKDSPSEIRQFSKRYSRSGRQNIADEIRELRFQYFKKEKGNSDRQDLIAEQEKKLKLFKKNRLKKILNYKK